MEKQIKQILEELYLVDGSFRAHEKELVKIIQELLASKPDTRIDQNFIKELRFKIINKSSTKENMFNFLFNRRFAYVSALVLVFVLIAGISTFLYKGEQNGQPLSAEEAIKDVGENAFGRIYLASQGENVQNRESQAFGMGGGGGLVLDTSVYPPEEQVNYKYAYVGEDFSIEENQVAVYRKAKGNSLGNSLRSALAGLKFDLVDLGSFGSKKITSIQISEDKEFGYSIYVDSINDNISININWERWPMDIYESPVAAMADEKAVAMADSFISSHGIDMSIYGEGEVLKPSYRGFISEDLTVVYPLEIEGRPVYDEGGQKYGIYVNVSSRHNRVASVSGISSNLFESSNYGVEIDEKKAVEIAEQGGMFGNYYYSGNGRTVSVELGTPEIKLVKVWAGANDKFVSNELFVPALVFPVVNNPEWTYFYRSNVIVPLVGSLTESNGGPIRIMEETLQKDLTE